MGGSSKKQTVGYKYYLGMHMILCHGPVDKLRQIKVDDRLAWQGDCGGGRINISAAGLFGGESREGGISGAVDFETGHSTQTRNDYLMSQLGASIPAFRGVVGVVLRQCYLGLNPYLKKWSFRVQRIHVRQNGIAQWYDAKSQIGTMWKEPQAIYMALDFSGSMAIVMPNGKTRLENLKDAVLPVLDYINELRNYSGVAVDLFVRLWGGSTSSASYFNINDAGITALKAFVSAGGYHMGTDFRLGVDAAPGFFASAGNKNKTILFATDGEPDHTMGVEWQESSSQEAGAMVASIPGVSSYAFNIDEENTHYTAYFDNTPADGVPVLDGGNPEAMKNALVFALSGQLDMNPAHIIRECLTDPDWGMGYQDSDIDDVSFMACADKLYGEAMGMSLLWDRQIAIEEFIKEVVKHIDAVLYVDRTTGKFTLKLIRNDFIEGDLVSLDTSNIDKITDFTRPAFGELTNSVTVTFWDAVTGTNSTVTVQDIALAQMQGATIATTVQYPGFTNKSIATRAAQRDLKTLSTPLASCTIYANRAAAGLNIGECFKLTWPDYDIENLVMRVTGIAYGDGKSNRVRLTCSQDVYSLPEVEFLAPTPPEWQDPTQLPTPALYRIVEEAPYYELVQRLGQSETDAKLADNPNLCYLLVTAAQPSGSINARLKVDSGGGYPADDDDTPVDFCPVGFLSSDVGYGDITFYLNPFDSYSSVKVGSHAQIDEELVKIVAVTSSSVTVGRGVIDTVPAAHSAGTPLFFWDEYADSDGKEYVTNETLKVKILPISGAGTMNIIYAPEDTITMVARAMKPFPPGKLEIGGLAYPVAIGGLASLSLSWAHRDRLLQTAGELQDTTVGNIGPEVGTTYNLRIYGEGGLLIKEVLNTAGTTFEYDAATEVADCEIPAAAASHSSLVRSLLHFNGPNDSTRIIDEKGLTWNVSGNAKLSTAQSKFGGASIYLNSERSNIWDNSALILHFNGANNSTAITDTSSHPKTVTNSSTNMVVSTAQSKFDGSSLYADGTGTGGIVVAANAECTFGSGDFTIELWAKPATDCPTCYILSNGTFFTAGVWILEPTHPTNPGKWCFFGFGIAETGSPLASTSDSLTNAWQHVAVTRKGTTLRMFINGVLEDTYTTSAAIDTGSTNAIYINPTASRYKGFIDEVLIHRTCLYEANFTPRTRAYRDLFNGDHIETALISDMTLGTDDFTVECWLYPTIQDDLYNCVIFDGRETSLSKSITLYARAISGSLLLSASSQDGLTATYGGSNITLNTWHHIAFVRSAGTLKAYLDGVSQWSLGYNYDAGTTFKSRIGTSKVSMSAVFGYIDDFRLTKSALYLANFTPPVSQFSDGSGGFRLNGLLRVELESERDTIISLQKHDYTVLREGYGFNYGKLYGGMA